MKSVHTGPAAWTELQNFQKNTLLMQHEKHRDTADSQYGRVNTKDIKLGLLLACGLPQTSLQADT